MYSTTFDTHKYIKQLQSKGISEEQSEAIVDVVMTLQHSNAHYLATKPEIEQYKSELRHDIEALENKIMHRVKDEILPLKTNITLILWMNGLIIVTLVAPALKKLAGL
jgi:uncharacterized protein YpuA (DUF1002 family)